MSEDSITAIILAAIGTAGVILAAAMPAYFNLLGKVKEAAVDSAISREQLQNSHTTNLREEGDERHAELLEKLEDHGKDIRGVRQDIGILHGADRDLRQEVAEDRAAAAKAIRQVAETAVAFEKLKPDIDRIIRAADTTATPPQGGSLN